MTHYDTLEVSPRASPEVIRAAYKSLMQRLHPDKAPDDAELAARAASVAHAYDVLSDPTRRALYDKSLREPAAAAAPAMRPRRESPAPRAGWIWPSWVLLLLSVAVVGGVLVYNRGQPDPRAELASIRRAIESGQTAEARRRELFARKLALLEQNPALEREERAAKSEDMAARTFALLDSPLTVNIPASAASGAAADTELTIPRATVLLGSFDASNLVSHMERHRERLIRDLGIRLASENASRLTGPDAQARLKWVMRESVSASLGIAAGGDYPSTYYESPGTYGVVEVVLPEGFAVVPPKAAESSR